MSLSQNKQYPKDGEPIEIIEGTWHHVCCECKTIHKVKNEKKGKKWYMTWWREAEPTEFYEAI